jgi:hypothetical protein
MSIMILFAKISAVTLEKRYKFSVANASTAMAIPPATL